jgi:hypothetical protein
MIRNEKFKLGQFKVSQTVGETRCDVLVDPLTQIDMADGWNMVLPKKKKTSTRHHFNIMLSQLPVHLWYRVKKYNDEYYYNISDSIYDYSIRVTNSDSLLLELYDETNKSYYNKTTLQTLYNKIDNEHCNGWLMIKTRQLLKV